MCGSATLTMVASRTTISCAVAMTSSATPRWRPPRRVLVRSVAENVVAMTSMLAAGRPAVVAHGNRLLAGQHGCRRAPAYSARSSRQSLPRADALAVRTRGGGVTRLPARRQSAPGRRGRVLRWCSRGRPGAGPYGTAGQDPRRTLRRVRPGMMALEAADEGSCGAVNARVLVPWKSVSDALGDLGGLAYGGLTVEVFT